MKKSDPIKRLIKNFEKINGELIYKKDFDADTIKCAILFKLNSGCLGLSPDIIILESDANPNLDEEILRVAKMYKGDFSIDEHSFLDIIADEAIYHQLLSLTSCLGIRFLDKFKMTVDYHSTVRVLDLIWTAVVIVISIYINNNGMTTSEIIDDDNNKNICLKLIHDLLAIFEMNNPLSHPLFQKYPLTEIYKEELDHLIAYYLDGLKQIKKVFNLNEPYSPDTTKPQFKKRRTTGSRHYTTKDETDILFILKVYKDKLPDNTIGSICEQLSDVWTIKRVREWWYYHKDK
ncbi:hypothetical protein C1646_761550 [Rhizophagus diaphanus]|nr:hypothetical protein C1646_761550 [Rhizophagus diaphanus] [Rhizophagus sp. MUCL 43196]